VSKKRPKTDPNQPIPGSGRRFESTRGSPTHKKALKGRFRRKTLFLAIPEKPSVRLSGLAEPGTAWASFDPLFWRFSSVFQIGSLNFQLLAVFHVFALFQKNLQNVRFESRIPDPGRPDRGSQISCFQTQKACFRALNLGQIK